MEMDKNPQQSAEYMRLAIPLMNQYGIALTPENYTVWYEYVAGNNLLLNEEIDKQLKSINSFSDKETQDIYNRFLSPGKEQVKLAKLRQELRRLIEELLGFTTNGANAAAESTALLEEALSQLHPDMSREQIHTVVQEVISETRHIMSSGKSLTQRLNAAAVEIEEFKNNVDDLKKQAKVDRLTNLDNRYSFDETILKITREAEHTSEPVSLIFCDLDSFKHLNENHGNLVGDQVLKIVAATLKAAVKGRDFVSRYGGKEFTITLVNTKIEDARRIAESIRNEIASKRIQRKDTKESLGQITMSFGVASYFPSEGVESFLQRADRALYQSKRNGRNTVSEALPPII